MRKLTILLSFFIALTLVVLSGCEIVKSDILQEGVFIEEEEPESEPAKEPEPAPEEPGISAWAQRFATWPIAFGFANDEGSKVIRVFYDFEDAEDEEEETPAATGPEVYGEDYDEAFDSAYEPSNYLEKTGFDPDAFSLAVGPYGEIWPIYFSHWQDEKIGNNGRENAGNFSRLPGFVFAQKEWKLRKNRTYLLTDMGPLLDSIIAIGPSGWMGNYPPLADETIESIEKYKERKVAWTKTLAVTKVGDGLIGLVVFERQGNDMLFSIVYMDEEKVLFWDNPAEYDEISTWRVDAGEMPGDFTPILLARFGEGLIMMLTWSAPESEIALTLYEEDGVLVEADELFSARYMP